MIYTSNLYLSGYRQITYICIYGSFSSSNSSSSLLLSLSFVSITHSPLIPSFNSSSKVLILIILNRPTAPRLLVNAVNSLRLSFFSKEGLVPGIASLVPHHFFHNSNNSIGVCLTSVFLQFSNAKSSKNRVT